jgi:rhamnulokinase
MTSHLAIDLGAESGRVVLGTVRDDGITIEELHRFPTQPIRIQGHWRWNVYRIFEEILEGLRRGAERGSAAVSLGVDTWGVDFGLLAKDGSLLGLPVAYRDARTEGMMERFVERVPKKTIYAKTGVQFMRLNSLYQLFAIAENDPALRDATAQVLFMPDLVHYLLSGARATEFTFATTTQLYNVHERGWDAELCRAAGFGESVLAPIQPTGATLAPIRPETAEQTGLPEIPIVMPATHDTGSAVAAIPAEGDDWAFISSGTWSLVGAEIREPICTPDALRYNFTNEGGVGGTYRFLKNIAGLWIVQRLREDFGAAKDYDDLMQLARDARPFRTFIDPDAEDFYHPASMVDAIQAYGRRTRQPIPESPGALVRCALESLALRYRQTLHELTEITSKPIARIHVVGGGSQNALLCQFTADATGLPIFAGPVESTALGNIIAQAVGTGTISSFTAGRALVQESTRPAEYLPRTDFTWEEAYSRFRQIAST